MEILFSRNFAVRPDILFEDFRDREIMKKWLHSDNNKAVELQSDFSPGGKYHIALESQIGDTSHFYGEYTQIDDERHIDMVWNDGEVDNSLVSFDFIKVGKNKTKLVVKHANLPNQDACKSHKRFWKSCLNHLDRYTKSTN